MSFTIDPMGTSSGSYTIESSNLWSSTTDNVYISNNHGSLAGISGVGDFMIGDQTIEEKVESVVKKALGDVKYNIADEEKSIFESLKEIDTISLTGLSKKSKKPYLNRLIDEHKKRCGGVLERLREEF